MSQAAAGSDIVCLTLEGTGTHLESGIPIEYRLYSTNSLVFLNTVADIVTDRPGHPPLIFGTHPNGRCKLLVRWTARMTSFSQGQPIEHWCEILT